MWKMYSTLEAGVRIRLKANPFKSHPPKEELYGKIIFEETYEGQKCLIPLEDMKSKMYLSRSAISGDILRQVKYTDDKELLYPQICHRNEDGKFSLSLRKLGLYKNTYWKFQREWRYIIETLPFSTMPITKSDLTNTAHTIINDNAKPPFSFYDMEIDDAAFDNMEITLSPGISKGNELIVQLLKKEYNPTAKIKKSALAGLVR